LHYGFDSGESLDHVYLTSAGDHTAFWLLEQQFILLFCFLFLCFVFYFFFFVFFGFFFCFVCVFRFFFFGLVCYL